MITTNFLKHHTTFSVIVFFCLCILQSEVLDPSSKEKQAQTLGGHSISPQAVVRRHEKLLMLSPNQDTFIMKALIFLPNQPSLMQPGNADGSSYHSKQAPKGQASSPSNWSDYPSLPSKPEAHQTAMEWLLLFIPLFLPLRIPNWRANLYWRKWRLQHQLKVLKE